MHGEQKVKFLAVCGIIVGQAVSDGLWDRCAFIFRVSLKVKTLESFETSETDHPTKQCHILEDLHFNKYVTV
jgi:hypothetical protein